MKKIFECLNDGRIQINSVDGKGNKQKTSCENMHKAILYARRK